MSVAPQSMNTSVFISWFFKVNVLVKTKCLSSKDHSKILRNIYDQIYSVNRSTIVQWFTYTLLNMSAVSPVSLVSTSAPIVLNIETVFYPYIPVPCSQTNYSTSILHPLIFISLTSTDLSFLPALQYIAVGPLYSSCVPAAAVKGSFNMERDLRK